MLVSPSTGSYRLSTGHFATWLLLTCPPHYRTFPNCKCTLLIIKTVWGVATAPLTAWPYEMNLLHSFHVQLSTEVFCSDIVLFYGQSLTNWQDETTDLQCNWFLSVWTMSQYPTIAPLQRYFNSVDAKLSPRRQVLLPRGGSDFGTRTATSIPERAIKVI